VDDEVGHAELLRHRDERPDVAVGGVHAAVGHEPDEMDALEALHRLAQDVVGAQLPRRHGLVDAQEVLLDDRARPEVEVADLRVAHLALGRPTAGPLAVSSVCG
jgi:hypothetical protein